MGNLTQVLVILVIMLTIVYESEGQLADCGHRSLFPVTWMNFPPYVFRADDYSSKKSNAKHLGAIHGLVQSMVAHCCGANSTVQLQTEVRHTTEVQEQLHDSVFAYPVTRRSQHNSLDPIIADWFFLPVVELPGSYVLVDLNTLNNVVLDALYGAWPLALLVLSSAGVAGFLMWFLDRSENTDHFPLSFVEGGWEGMWWAIVTATTVGYGDRAPRSIPARIFGLIWMLLGIILMSVFTATLVSAIQAEDKIGSDIRGSEVAVVSGSQEERYAFVAGANPTSFRTLEDVLDVLESGNSDFALVDPFYALYFSNVLKARNIHPQDILPHTGVQGVLTLNMTDSANQCFAKYVAIKHHEAFEFMMSSLGSLKTMRGKTAHHQSRKLLGSNMLIIYACCATFLLMFTSCCVWELICYQPKLRRLKAKARSKQIEGYSHECLLGEKDDTHSL